VLVFVDADLAIEDALLVRVWELMRDPRCLGRAVQVRYEPARRAVRAYLAAWGLAARLAGIGGVQFCRRAAFEAPKGYDESLYMGEDADFFRRLRRLGGRERRRVVVRDRGGWYEEALR